MSSPQGTEKINEGGVTEKKVETVDHRLPAGKDENTTTESVGVVHLKRDGRGSSGNSNPVFRAARAVANVFRSAKDAVSGGGKEGPK